MDRARREAMVRLRERDDMYMEKVARHYVRECLRLRVQPLRISLWPKGVN